MCDAREMNKETLQATKETNGAFLIYTIVNAFD